MNKKQWLSAGNKEKAIYLLNGDVNIKKRTGIKANSKIGDNDSCVNVFTAFVGVVQISNDVDTSVLAMEQAIDVLTDWKKEI